MMRDTPVRTPNAVPSGIEGTALDGLSCGQGDVTSRMTLSVVDDSGRSGSNLTTARISSSLNPAAPPAAFRVAPL